MKGQGRGCWRSQERLQQKTRVELGLWDQELHVQLSRPLRNSTVSKGHVPFVQQKQNASHVCAFLVAVLK